MQWFSLGDLSHWGGDIRVSPKWGDLRDHPWRAIWKISFFPCHPIFCPKNVEFVISMNLLVILLKMSSPTVHRKWEILDLELLLIPCVHHSKIWKNIHRRYHGILKIFYMMFLFGSKHETHVSMKSHSGHVYSVKICNENDYKTFWTHLPN